MASPSDRLSLDFIASPADATPNVGSSQTEATGSDFVTGLLMSDTQKALDLREHEITFFRSPRHDSSVLPDFDDQSFPPWKFLTPHYLLLQTSRIYAITLSPHGSY